MLSFVRTHCRTGLLLNGLLLASLALSPLSAMALDEGQDKVRQDAVVKASDQPQAQTQAQTPHQTQAGSIAGSPAAAPEAKPSAQEALAAQEKAPVPQTGSHKRGNVPAAPMTLIRHLEKETDLPAMQLSLGLVNFVGETTPQYAEEEAYAIMPLGHDAVLEVYDLHYDGNELTGAMQPRLVRKMGPNEAYVLRVPTFGGVPAKGICVVSNNRRNCWNPGNDNLNEGFLRWSRTKNLK